MTSPYRERSSFERELLAQLRSRLKGSGWKLSQTALFKESDGIYFDVIVSVHRDASLTTAELRIKPMQLALPTAQSRGPTTARSHCL